jgi:hypothetical protein
MKPIGSGNYLVRPYKVYKNHSYTLTYPSASDAVGRFSVDEALPPPDSWLWQDELEPVNSSTIPKHTLYAGIKARYYPKSAITGSNVLDGYSRNFNPSGSFYVLGLSHFAIGEGIKPGTVKIRVNGSEDYIADDGQGRLYYSGDPSTIIGNVFYGVGILVVNKGTYGGGGGGQD